MKLLKSLIVLLAVGFGLFVGIFYFSGSSPADMKNWVLNLVRSGARIATRSERIMQKRIAKHTEEDSGINIKFADRAIHVEGADTYLQMAREKNSELQGAVQNTLTEAQDKLGPSVREKISKYIKTNSDSETISIDIESRKLVNLLTEIYEQAPTEETKELLKKYARIMKETNQDTIVNKIKSTLANDTIANTKDT